MAVPAVMAAALALISAPAARGSAVFTVNATFSDAGTLAGTFNPTSPYTGTSLTFTDSNLDCTPCTPTTLTGSDASDIFFSGCVLGAGDFCYVDFNADFSAISPGGTDTISFVDDFGIRYATTCASNCGATLQSSTPEPSSAVMILWGCAGMLGSMKFFHRHERDVVRLRHALSEILDGL
jgi:hypothetical protein